MKLTITTLRIKLMIKVNDIPCKTKGNLVREIGDETIIVAEDGEKNAYT